MLPTALLRRCGLRLLRQARAPAAAAAAAPGQMSFTFASPTQVYFNEANVKQVDVPTQSGAFGILAAHVPTLQVLKPGVVTVHAEDGTTTKYFVSSGSVTVNADSSVQLLAEEAVALDMLDLATAKSNLEKAHSDLSGASVEAARTEVQIHPDRSQWRYREIAGIVSWGEQRLPRSPLESSRDVVTVLLHGNHPELRRPPRKEEGA